MVEEFLYSQLKRQRPFSPSKRPSGGGTGKEQEKERKKTHLRPRSPTRFQAQHLIQQVHEARQQPHLVVLHRPCEAGRHEAGAKVRGGLGGDRAGGGRVLFTSSSLSGSAPGEKGEGGGKKRDVRSSPCTKSSSSRRNAARRTSLCGGLCARTCLWFP